MKEQLAEQIASKYGKVGGVIYKSLLKDLNDAFDKIEKKQISDAEILEAVKKNNEIFKRFQKAAGKSRADRTVSTKKNAECLFLALKDACLEVFGIADITKKTRLRPYVYARGFAWVYLWTETDITLKEMGKMCGGYDHSTVIYSIQRHDDYCSSDEAYRELWGCFCSTVKKYRNDTCN